MKKHTFPLTPEEREELLDANLVSFDLFDTIVFRIDPFRHQVAALGIAGFLVRKSLEFGWRLLQKLKIVKEFRLAYLKFFFGEKIDKEFTEDLKQLLPRPTIIELIEELLNHNVEVVVVTNSYYSLEQIRMICGKFGLPNSIKIYVSSEYGLIKRQGLMVSAYGPLPRPHWHFGDNLKEDGAVSLDHFVIVTSIWEMNALTRSFASTRSFNSPSMRPLRVVFLKLMQKYGSETDQLFWFGVFLSGPLSIFVSQRVESYAKCLEADTYYLARDGYLPYRYSKGLKNTNAFYLPYSRKISQSSDELDRLVQFVNQKESKYKVFFDLGWTGNSANRIKQKTFDNGKLVLGGRWPWIRNSPEDAILFWGKYQILRAIKFRSFPEIFELALSAPHASLSEAPFDFTNWSDGVPLDEQRGRIARGAIIFQDSWRKNGDTNLNQKMVFPHFFNLINDPPIDFIQMLSQFEHDFNEFKVPLVSHTRVPVIFWLKGSLRLQKINKVSLTKRTLSVYREIIRRVK